MPVAIFVEERKIGPTFPVLKFETDHFNPISFSGHY